MFPNPEDLAFGRSASRQALYQIKFEADTLWNGGEGDVLVEIFDFWLEAA